MYSICMLGWGFPKTSSIATLTELYIFDGQNDLSKGNEPMTVNLLLINKYSRFIQRHHVLVPCFSAALCEFGRGDVWWQLTAAVHFSSLHAFGKPGPVCLSRPPLLGLASCTSSGSASRPSGHPHPSAPGQHRGGASCRLTQSHGAASLTQPAGTVVV